jgi:4-amino-4-deoxy-L-arabinose transferase-like glycosyltransferase
VTDRPPFARAGVALVVATLGLALLVMAPFYGPHRDELYFASAGQRLAWGYPDQPALVAVLARVAAEIDPHNLVLLRIPSLLTLCLLVFLAALTARLLGGGRRAQVLAALTTGTAAVCVTVGHRLSTQTFDIAAWAGIALLAGHALRWERPRLWLLAGLVAGVGLNAKHDVAVCLLGLLLGLCLTRSARHHLRSPWLWLGGLLALVLWLPNLLWQADHGWPVFELSADIAEEYGGLAGTAEYLLLTLVIFSPLMTVVWAMGLWGLFRRPEWEALRPLGWMFVVTFVFFLFSSGKAYYLSGAIVPLLAAGCVLVAERARRFVAVSVALVVSAVVAWPAMVPVLPPRTYATSFYPAIDQDQLETIGWPELVDTVRTALEPLPGSAVVLTGNYGEAGALEWYGVNAPVHSGHNGWGDWGPPPDGAAPVVLVGYGERAVERNFDGCTSAGTVPTVDGADNDEAGGTVWVCDGPRLPWSRVWSRLVHLDA